MGLVVKNKAKKDVQHEIEEFFSEVGLKTIQFHNNNIFNSQNPEKNSDFTDWLWKFMEDYKRKNVDKLNREKKTEGNERF